MSTIKSRRVQGLPWTEGDRVLDLGCGKGETLQRAIRSRHTLVVGVDTNIEDLRMAKSVFPNAHFVCARGESLPFRENAFDCVVSGVALPYMEIPKTLGEIHRVLSPKGSVWLTLHSLRMELIHWFRSWRKLDFKDVVFRAYVLLNGTFFYLTGRIVRFPAGLRLCESYQSRRGMRLALRHAGFEDTEVAKVFIASATKPN